MTAAQRRTATRNGDQARNQAFDDACVLNRIAQLLSADGAAEINYKGKKPNDIDRLVCAAVAKPDFAIQP